jgi:hypothetical protein
MKILKGSDDGDFKVVIIAVREATVLLVGRIYEICD